MTTFTPQQQQMLQTWATQRDSLIKEIGSLTTELEEKKKENIAQGLALADLHTSIAETRGRLAEISAVEQRHKDSVSVEVAELEARKNRLEGECTAKENELKLHDQRIAEKASAIELLSKMHDRMADQAAIVDQVVGQVIDISQKHIAATRDATAEVQTVFTAVLERANKNLSETKIVLEKMPKIIFEMQKPIPVRRTYPLGHPYSGTDRDLASP